MNIEYETKRVEKYFDDLSEMNKKIGNDLTRMVKKRYDSLKASKSFYIYLSTRLGNPHKLSHGLEGCYGISVSGNYRLVVKPIVESLEPEALKACDTIEIKGVEDYHGGKQEWIIP